MHNKTQDNIKLTHKTKAMFSRLLQHPVWKRTGSNEKISKGGDKYGKVRKGRGEAYDVNKQIIHIAPKAIIESRAHYAPEPARGYDSVRSSPNSMFLTL